jgi:ADP-ribose pyrophosphatase YjhB (NUDIX family)
LEVEYPRSLHCRACGHRAYYNPKPVACAIPCTPDGDIILMRRGFDPGAGLWTFPGGHVDLGETIEAAALRETLEELEIEVELQRLVGVYSRPDDPIVLVVYQATTVQEPRTTTEAIEVRAFAPDAIPWDELAFWSTALALRDVLE